MKRILVLLAIVMFVATGMSVFASDVTTSGSVSYGFITNFDEFKPAGGYANVDVSAVVDDYNTATVSFTQGNQGDVTGSPNWGFSNGTWYESYEAEIDEAYFTTDLLGPFGVGDYGVSMALTTGYKDFGTPYGYGVTGYGLEAWAGHNTSKQQGGKDWGMQLDVGIMDMVNIWLAAQPASGFDALTGGFFMAGLDGAYDFGMVDMYGELFYGKYNGDVEADNGDFGLGVKAGIDAVPDMVAVNVGGGFEYNLNADALDGNKFFYGAGVGADLMASLANVGISLYGNDNSLLNAMAVDASVAPLDFVGLDLGAVFGLDSDSYTTEQQFNELDASAWVKFGAAKVRLGYLFADYSNAGGNIARGLNAPTNWAGTNALPANNPEAGGMYVNASVSF